jgi:hypothetical protein
VLIRCDGTCGTAKAQAAEIAFLREQVKTLTTQLVNLADPLAHARLNRPARPERATEEAPQPHHNASMIRHQMEDRPPERPRPRPRPAEVEAGFEEKGA